MNFERDYRSQTTKHVNAEANKEDWAEAQPGGQKNFEERDQIEKDPVAILLLLQQLYRREEDNEVRQRCDTKFAYWLANGFLILPVEKKQRDRKKHCDQA